MILGQDEMRDLFWTGHTPLDPDQSWLVAFACNHLRLARPLVADQRPPCENEA